MDKEPNQDALISTLFRLLETRSWHDISLADIALESGTDLAELRARIDGRFSVLEKFARQIDVEVIKAVDPDLKGEPARERLFDILMSRLDALEPFKSGIAGLARSARRDPLLAAQLNRLACTSQGWMLEAVGISRDGLIGALRIQGLVLAFSRVLSVWLKDDDPDMARTMAELDKVLRRGETVLDTVSRFCAAMPSAAGRRRTAQERDDLQGRAEA